MTHIEQAIRDAVEKGGWKPADMFGDREAKPLIKLVFGQSYFEGFTKVADFGGGLFGRYAYSSSFLDPSFWQALGKARYYTKNTQEGSVRSKLWLQDWHRFIDHLASRADAESFFATLE